MKKKIGTIIDEEVLTAAKKKAVLRKQPLNQFFEEALKLYISVSENTPIQKICTRTKGSMAIPLSDLKKIMAEDAYNET